MTLSSFAARVKNKILYHLRLDQRLRNWDDERYLKLIFRIKMGQRLNLDSPRTFSEKLQWLKIHDRRPIYTHLVDKFEVKEWVTALLGESRVVPVLGVWDSFSDIDFDALPEQFVLKCTHDSGGLAICTDRTSFDIERARTKISNSLKRNYYALGREWPYKNVQPRVIAERYFPTWDPESPDGILPKPLSNDDLGVMDFKFYCFHGEPKFLYVSRGLHNHSTAQVAFLTLDWKRTDFKRQDYAEFDELPPKPARLEEMIRIAETLSSGIPFVRVDLFEHANTVLFSEMTFHPVSGMMPISPRSADSEIGKLLDLPESGSTTISVSGHQG